MSQDKSNSGCFSTPSKLMDCWFLVCLVYKLMMGNGGSLLFLVTEITFIWHVIRWLLTRGLYPHYRLIDFLSEDNYILDNFTFTYSESLEFRHVNYNEDWRIIVNLSIYKSVYSYSPPLNIVYLGVNNSWFELDLYKIIII